MRGINLPVLGVVWCIFGWAKNGGGVWRDVLGDFGDLESILLSYLSRERIIVGALKRG